MLRQLHLHHLLIQMLRPAKYGNYKMSTSLQTYFGNLYQFLLDCYDNGIHFLVMCLGIFSYRIYHIYIYFIQNLLFLIDFNSFSHSLFLFLLAFCNCVFHDVLLVVFGVFTMHNLCFFLCHSLISFFN